METETLIYEGATAVITGCNRGIGKAVLTEFLKGGIDVFAVVRTCDDVFLRFCEELKKKTKRNVWIIKCDFEYEEQINAAVKQIRIKKREISMLINNIGICPENISCFMTSQETLKNTFQVNYFAPMLFTQQIGRLMMRSRLGNKSIVFVSSTAAFDGGNSLEYVSSKSALTGAVKRLAREFGKWNIRVNAVAPGFTDTDMGNKQGEEMYKIAMERCIIKRKATPEEIAYAISFLASEKSSYITGQILRVDGGMM